MSEYIGSRISLISKSDIKYIGNLHEINSDTHTVALESVISYGTEGRKGNPAEEIPGSDQVYEYIVFRGSDVKELKIVAPPGAAKENNAPPKMPDDPAILGSARPAPPNQQQPPPQSQIPPQQPPHQSPFNSAPGPYSQPPPPPFGGYHGPPPPNAFPNPSRFQGPGGPHGFPGTPGAVPGFGAGYPPPPPGYYGPPPGQGFPQQGPPPNFPHQQPLFEAPGQPIDAQRAPQQPPPMGSKQGTPQPPSTVVSAPRKATPPVPGMISEKNAAAATAPVSATQPPPSAPINATTPGPSAPPTASQPPTAPKAWTKPNNRVAVPLPAANRAAQPPQRQTANVAAPPSADQPQSIADATQAATAAVAAAMAKLGNQNQAQSSAIGGGDNLAQRFNQMGIQDSQRGRGRGRGGAPRGARRESASKQIDVPKEDFDFESSNAKFNKEDLVKEAIASGSPIASPVDGVSANTGAPMNGDVNGDAGGTDDVVIPPKSTTEKGYDKQSSFFDNISSDLKDRIQQQSERDASAIDGRTLRREERSKNVETFGQGSVDSGGHRGGYRGRGRGHRGFGHASRGGGGYRGGGGGYAPRGGAYRGRGGRGASESTFA